MKKNKLQKLVGKLSLLQGNQPVVSPYFDPKITDIASAVRNKNITKKIGELNAKFNFLLDAVKKQNFPSKDEFSSLLKKHDLLDLDIKDNSIEISKMSKEMKNAITDFNKEFAEIKKDISSLEFASPSEMVALSEGIAQMRIEFLSRLAGLGGGSMNRQIKVNGSDPLTRYTDVNLIAGSGVTLSSTNNDTNKNVEITITGTGSGGLTEIVVSGTRNDVNLIFTSVTQPSYLVINGGWYKPTGGSTTWTWVAGTITLSTPVGTGGTIWGF